MLGKIMNTWRRKPLSDVYLFIMSYGGLRGAVSFAMAASMHEEKGNDLKEQFMAVTLGVIFATVFLQGATIKLLVHQCGLKDDKKTATKFTSLLLERVVRHNLACAEAVFGYNGCVGLHILLDRLERIEKKYVYSVMVSKAEKNDLPTADDAIWNAVDRVEDDEGPGKRPRRKNDLQYQLQEKKELNRMKRSLMQGESEHEHRLKFYEN